MNKDKQVEEKKEGVITMCCSQGLFFIGRLVSGGPKLLQPRIFTIFDEQERDKQNRLLWLDEAGETTIVNTGIPYMVEKIGMRAFPGVPPFINIGTNVITYPVVTNTMNLLTLYAQVTSGAVKKFESPDDRPKLSLVGQQNPPEVKSDLIPTAEEKPLMGPRRPNEVDPKLN